MFSCLTPSMFGPFPLHRNDARLCRSNWHTICHNSRFASLGEKFIFVGGGALLARKAYDHVQQFKHRALLRCYGRDVIGEVTGFSFGRYTPMSVVYSFTVNGATYFGKALERENPGVGTSLDKGDKILVRCLIAFPSGSGPNARLHWAALL